MGEHALHDPSVDGANHRMLNNGIAERAVLGNDSKFFVFLCVLGASGEAVGRKGIGDCMQRSL
ncbi:MAG: hypothetical protein CL433_09060, partial [Acidimicrobiaceae bacterium]|nr:hypothetical protein [Acidimicrobiaceae bacterium]